MPNLVNVAKLASVLVLVIALVAWTVMGLYPLYLDTQIGHANPAAASNPRPEPWPASPGVIAPTSDVEAK